MLFGRYKKKGYEDKRIYLCKDMETEKWYATNFSDRTYSQLFDSLEELREGLRLYKANWYDLRKHIDTLCEIKIKMKKCS